MTKEHIIAPPGFNRWLVPPAAIAAHPLRSSMDAHRDRWLDHGCLCEHHVHWRHWFDRLHGWRRCQGTEGSWSDRGLIAEWREEKGKILNAESIVEYAY